MKRHAALSVGAPRLRGAWLNGEVALIHWSDGYILDIARHAWR